MDIDQIIRIGLEADAYADVMGMQGKHYEGMRDEYFTSLFIAINTRQTSEDYKMGWDAAIENERSTIVKFIHQYVPYKNRSDILAAIHGERFI